MKQFIRYLYEYGQGKRTRNVGFVKVEQEDTESIIHIHGKGLRLSREDSLKVYLLFDEGGSLSGLMQGEIAYMGPAINYRLKYTKEDTGAPENYDRIEGILLENRSGKRFAALWEEGPADVDHIKAWTGNIGKETPEEEAMREGTEEAMPERMPEGTEEAMPEGMEGRAASKAPSAAMPGDLEGAALPEGNMEAAPEERVEEMDGRSAALHEEKQEEPRFRTTKIQRGEIARLPRCEWRLANNNFLLHGYYNYRYLVLLDDGNVLKLGVPGLYHKKEARAAANLGFPEFIDVKETGLFAAPDEEDSEEQRFGFWCRQVRRPAM